MKELADLAHCNTMSALPPCEAVQRAGCIAHYINDIMLVWLRTMEPYHKTWQARHTACSSCLKEFTSKVA